MGMPESYCPSAEHFEAQESPYEVPDEARSARHGLDPPEPLFLFDRTLGEVVVDREPVFEAREVRIEILCGGTRDWRCQLGRRSALQIEISLTFAHDALLDGPCHLEAIPAENLI
jgi:hypothetical protein